GGRPSARGRARWWRWRPPAAPVPTKSSRCASNKRCAPKVGGGGSAVGDDHPGRLGPRPVEHGDVADAVHERAAGAARELGEELIARRAITSRSLHLDELVIAEGARGLRGDRFRQSRAAEAHHGLQGVGETAQVPSLTLGELGRGGACCGRSVRRGAAGRGAWSQYARQRVGRSGRIVATDILAIRELAGVEFVQGDFREEAVFGELLRRLPGRQVDLVLSDMAPALSGVDVIDQPRSLDLAELALDLAARVLKPGGAALIKVFQGAGLRELVESARKGFARVKLVKPTASRSRSPEMYLLAMQFRLV